MSKTATNINWYSFSVSIANLTVQGNCSNKQLAQKLQERYQKFTAQQKPELQITIQWIGKERVSSMLDTKMDFRDGVLSFSAVGYQGFINEKTGLGELNLSSAHPLEDIDYYLRVAFALLAHDAGGLLVHTAGIVYDGYTYLFFGHSGSGKTTVCKVSADTHMILNDDLVLLLPQGDVWYAYGTPFWNPTQIEPSNQSAPIASMYHLIQAEKVFTRKMSPAQATAAIIANIPVIPQDPLRSAHLLDILTRLQKAVSIFELYFLPDNSFWNVIPK
jgi:hypothetical protein